MMYASCHGFGDFLPVAIGATRAAVRDGDTDATREI
jgi:hypothetical protein